MGNRVCPDCGEEYSTTYRKCPFCEEDAALKQGTPIHRRGGRRLEKGRDGGVGGILLVVLGVVVLGMVGYALVGDRIADAVGIRFLFYRCLVVAVLCIACILAGILRACILGAVGRILAGIVCIAAVAGIAGVVVCIVCHNHFLLMFL